jgi:hypothetical protein
MTTDHSRSDETDPKPKKPATKPEPAGNLESDAWLDSSDYKPEWLETGRLSADSIPHREEEQRTVDNTSFAPAVESGTAAVGEERAKGFDAVALETETPAEGGIEPVPPAIAAGLPPEEPPLPPRPSFMNKRPDRLSTGLFIASLLLFGAAALIYFLNPFTRLALGAASLARPVSSPETALPRDGSGAWCLQGDFLAGDEAPALLDNGEGGDILSDDLVFTLDYPIAQPGSYNWQIVDCQNPALAYPQAPAWAVTTEPNQIVTFLFDSDEREAPLFFPIPFAVTALDNIATYRVVGSFQEWDEDDPTNLLEPISSGIFQQVRRIARSGSYEAYVIAGEEEQAVDAYGRTTEPIPFMFETTRNGDLVVFMLDEDRGRASVIYDVPPLMIALAFGNGYRLLSLALAGLGLALLVGLALRLLVVRNPKWQMESGCPNCGEHELLRISRHSSDRLLNLVGVPAYRYRCRSCTWEGARLSEHGRSVSPGATIAPANYRS